MEHDRMLAALQSSIFDLKAQIQQNLTETNQKIEHVSRIIEEKFAMLSLKLDSEAESRKEEDKSLKTKAASLQDMIHSLEKIQEFEKIDSENKNAKINQLQFQITQLEATVDKKHSEICSYFLFFFFCTQFLMLIETKKQQHNKKLQRNNLQLQLQMLMTNCRKTTIFMKKNWTKSNQISKRKLRSAIVQLQKKSQIGKNNSRFCWHPSWKKYNLLKKKKT